MKQELVQLARYNAVGTKRVLGFQRLVKSLAHPTKSPSKVRRLICKQMPFKVQSPKALETTTIPTLIYPIHTDFLHLPLARIEKTYVNPNSANASARLSGSHPRNAVSTFVWQNAMCTQTSTHEVHTLAKNKNTYQK